MSPPEKSPARSMRLGIVFTRVDDSRMSVISMSPNRNARFLFKGPPTEKPYWSRANGGLSAPWGTKKFLASMRSLRRNSNTDPCSSLVPDLVVIVTTPPMERPNSAEYALVRILNSWTASSWGLMASFWLPWEAIDWLLLSMPSMMKFTCVAWEPPTLMPCRLATSDRAGGVTPAEIRASCR